jgi:hypothetical protein
MLAYGKLSRDLMAGGYSQGRLGFEFAGTLPGAGAPRRVMGVARQAIATLVGAPQYLVRARGPPVSPGHTQCMEECTQVRQRGARRMASHSMAGCRARERGGLSA